MQRRRFIQATCTVAVVAGIPGVGSAISTDDRSASRTAFNLGDRVCSESGTWLVVSDVSETRSDVKCHQYEVCFDHVEGLLLAEGVHVLNGSDGSREVFMQPTRRGLRAHFSHLI